MYSGLIKRIPEASIWAQAQIKHQYGECKGFFHNLLYRETRTFTSKIKADGSRATLFVCKKCNGVKSSIIIL